MGSSRLNAILHHPSIWPMIAPDGVAPFDLEERDDYQYDWYRGGVVIFHPFRDGLKIHPNFLPGYRGRYALASIRRSLKHCPVPVYAEINADLRHVRAMAVHSGFELVGRGDRLLYRRLPCHS